jgi:hypothetical protein
MGNTSTSKLYVVALVSDGTYYRIEPNVVMVLPGDRVSFQNLSGCKATLLFPEKGLFSETEIPLEIGEKKILDIPSKYVEAGAYPFSVFFHGTLTKASSDYEPAIIVYIEEQDL